MTSMNLLCEQPVSLEQYNAIGQVFQSNLFDIHIHVQLFFFVFIYYYEAFHSVH